MIKNVENNGARPMAGLTVSFAPTDKESDEASLMAAFGVSQICSNSTIPSGGTFAFCHIHGILRLPLPGQVAEIYGIMPIAGSDCWHSPDFRAVMPGASCSKKNRQKALHLPLTMAEMKTN